MAMAWTPPSRHELRERVRIERRSPSGENIGGVVREAWDQVVSDRRVRLLPQRGGESVIADRLSGLSVWIMDVPADTAIRTIGDGAGMRVVDARNTARVFSIKSCLDLEGADRWRTLTLELVAVDG
jgi:hypothetical protein